MYVPRGLKRAERELATVVVSIINGCVYCSSVHARRFVELTKQPEIIRALYDQGLDTPLEPRLRAIVDYAAKLTREPAAMTVADLAPLRAVGMDDLEIHDLTNAVAMFANANRLMQTLGEPVLPERCARDDRLRRLLPARRHATRRQMQPCLARSHERRLPDDAHARTAQPDSPGSRRSCSLPAISPHASPSASRRTTCNRCFPWRTTASCTKPDTCGWRCRNRFGGDGADVFDMVLAQEILARGDASTALVTGMHLSVARPRDGWRRVADGCAG